MGQLSPRARLRIDDIGQELLGCLPIELRRSLLRVLVEAGRRRSANSFFRIPRLPGGLDRDCQAPHARQTVPRLHCAYRARRPRFSRPPHAEV